MITKKYHHGDLKNSLVQAGIEILSREGAGELSLRKVASYAGVSHSAPYAHFNDKQDLLAAISAESFRQLYDRIRQVSESKRFNAAERLIEVGWTYVQFALDNRACFKLMFSGVLEKEDDYPEYVDISRDNFLQLVGLVRDCQFAGVLPPGPEDVQALSVWSLVHGFVSLLLEQQISHTITERQPLRELMCQVLNSVTLVEIVLPVA